MVIVMVVMVVPCGPARGWNNRIYNDIIMIYVRRYHSMIVSYDMHVYIRIYIYMCVYTHISVFDTSRDTHITYHRYHISHISYIQCHMRCMIYRNVYIYISQMYIYIYYIQNRKNMYNIYICIILSNIYHIPYIIYHTHTIYIYITHTPYIYIR